MPDDGVIEFTDGQWRARGCIQVLLMVNGEPVWTSVSPEVAERDALRPPGERMALAFRPPPETVLCPPLCPPGCCRIHSRYAYCKRCGGDMKRAEPPPASELPRAFWVGYHGSPVIVMSTVAALDVSAWYGVGAAVVLFAAQLGRWLTAEG